MYVNQWLPLYSMELDPVILISHSSQLIHIWANFHWLQGGQDNECLIYAPKELTNLTLVMV